MYIKDMVLYGYGWIFYIGFVNINKNIFRFFRSFYEVLGIMLVGLWLYI